MGKRWCQRFLALTTVLSRQPDAGPLPCPHGPCPIQRLNGAAVCGFESGTCQGRRVSLSHPTRTLQDTKGHLLPGKTHWHEWQGVAYTVAPVTIMYTVSGEGQRGEAEEAQVPSPHWEWAENAQHRASKAGAPQTLLPSAGWESGPVVCCPLCQLIAAQPVPALLLISPRTAVSRALASAVVYEGRRGRAQAHEVVLLSSCLPAASTWMSQSGCCFPGPQERVEEGLTFCLCPGLSSFRNGRWDQSWEMLALGREGPELLSANRTQILPPACNSILVMEPLLYFGHLSAILLPFPGAQCSSPASRHQLHDLRKVVGPSVP